MSSMKAAENHLPDSIAIGLMLRSAFVAWVIMFSSLTLSGSAEISIRLYAASRPSAIIFTPVEGEYLLEIPGAEPQGIVPGEYLLIYRIGERLAVKPENSFGVITDSITLRGQRGSLFSLFRPGDDEQRRVYDDNLTCRIDNGMFLILNETAIERYLPGVVEAEGGNGIEREFFRAQAVIARTYAYRNIDKHDSDRYNLCDDVHCQAFYGRATNREIDIAVEDTRGMVLTMTDSMLIDAAFHSNCGGETISSGDAWLTPRSYLQSVIDPYCLSSPNALWNSHLELKRWIDFLHREIPGIDTSDSAVFSFNQDKRVSYLPLPGGKRIDVTAIRNEFGLRSAFFSFSRNDDILEFQGRGYGHGVGLCQEGAIVMAARGFTFQQIVTFYYTGIIIIDVGYSKMPGLKW